MRIILLITLIFYGCRHLENHVIPPADPTILMVNRTDASINFKNGSWHYKGLLFSGTIRDLFEDASLHQSTPCSDGKENGWQVTFYPDGSLSEKRYFRSGEKDSVHTGWWQNGNKRFEYHFSAGIYNGEYKEWYQSGKPLKHIQYINGKDICGKGWRENGKIYMNFIVKNGRRYGVNNANLCYTVKNGSGELVKSIPGY